MKRIRWTTKSAAALKAMVQADSVDDAVVLAITAARKQLANQGNGGGILAPPYDPVPLALHFGAQCIQSGDLGHDGHVKKDEDGKIIVEYNRSELSPQRRRFTIAHETGHLLLWKALGRVLKMPAYRSPRGSEIERLCNKIAAEILTPRREVLKLWIEYRNQHGYSRKCEFIVTLMRIFDISSSFAAVRFRELCMPNCRAAFYNSKLNRLEWTHGRLDRADLFKRMPDLISKHYEKGVETFILHPGFDLINRRIEWLHLKGGMFLVVVTE